MDQGVQKMTRDQIRDWSNSCGLGYRSDLHPMYERLFRAAYEMGAVAERETCAQICADRAKDFQDLLEKYGHEQDAGANIGASQCEELIRARGEA
jgi:hypothetical protein